MRRAWVVAGLVLVLGVVGDIAVAVGSAEAQTTTTVPDSSTTTEAPTTTTGPPLATEATVSDLSDKVELAGGLLVFAAFLGVILMVRPKR